MKDTLTLESLKEEVFDLEQELASNARKRERLRNFGDRIENDNLDIDAAYKTGKKVGLLEKLTELDGKTAYLSLAQDIGYWASSSNSCKTLSDEVGQCTALANLLCRHRATTAVDKSLYGQTYSSLWTDEYLPLHKYLRQSCLQSLNQSLHSSGYPSEEACKSLLDECLDVIGNDSPGNNNNTSVATICQNINRLQISHEQLVLHLNPDKTNDMSVRIDFVLELCKPILDRLRYHFVEQNQERITTTRTDRLPEWLFNYLKEHIFEGGPWELVLDGIGPLVGDRAVVGFCREIVGLAQWVLTQRNFFRHSSAVGPNSNASVLCGAIEQLLLFDTYSRDLIPLSAKQQPECGLADAFLASDEELWEWWLGKEKEWAISTLFETQMDPPSALLSPRAEMFCALMHSIQCKANAFLPHSKASYLGHVAVPAYTQFLDAIHDSSTELRGLLSQKNLDLDKNLCCWMEIINGTQVASLVLIGDVDAPDNDLSRVGRSMERLRDVLVGEFATTFVEKVLMERAKLASYIMRCSHLLSSTAIDVSSDKKSLSPDLHQFSIMLIKVLTFCNKHTIDTKTQGPLGFAPCAIRIAVSNLVAEKFLEIALDAHGMTPDVELDGAIIFERDVQLVADMFSPDKTAFIRLVDAAKFMAAPTDQLITLREAITGLVTDGPEQQLLDFRNFSVDKTLFDSATSMLRAKGYVNLYLEDAISILNRRKDTFSLIPDGF